MTVDEQVFQDRMGTARFALRTGLSQQRESPFAGLLSALRMAAKIAHRNPPAALSAVFIVSVTLAAIFAPVVAPYNPLAIAPAERLQGPSAAHWLGTDNLGRDVLSRIIHGARTSMFVGLMVVLVGSSIGTAIGLVCGYFGGLLDTLFNRLMDAMQAFPGLIFALALISVLGASTNNVVIAIAFYIAPGDARIIRSAVLRVKGSEFVQASRSVGCSDLRLMLRHVVPNIIGPLTIIASVAFGGAILAESALSFLGLGTPPPNPSWGSMLSGAGRQYMEQVPTLALFPGLAIVLSVLSFNLLGDALRDIFDPKTRKL